jgi:hypothetical protein
MNNAPFKCTGHGKAVELEPTADDALLDAARKHLSKMQPATVS